MKQKIFILPKGTPNGFQRNSYINKITEEDVFANFLDKYIESLFVDGKLKRRVKIKITIE